MNENDRRSVTVKSSTADLERLARVVRTYIVRETTAAGSGHVTSSFSATELMTALFFHRLRFDLNHPEFPNNDRVVFSKGHASPLLYALYAAAGAIPEAQLDTLRRLGSPLEGHPTPHFRYADAATGSLGQGLSMGLGMALSAKKLDQLSFVTWVLMGDEEGRGSVWEAAELASHCRLNNLVAICDIAARQAGPRCEHPRRSIALRGGGWKTRRGRAISTGCLCDAIDGEAKRPIAIVAQDDQGRGFSLIADKRGAGTARRARLNR
jgi:transketolase